MLVIYLEGAAQEPVAVVSFFVIHGPHIITVVVGIIRVYEGQNIAGIGEFRGSSLRCRKPMLMQTVSESHPLSKVTKQLDICI